MRRRGSYWEKQALKYLRRQGLKLVCRNYLCPLGEVDLIMRHHDTLVFVEVRFRAASGWVSAAESVTLAKQRKVIRAAAHYLQRHQRYANMPCRFDVLAISQSAAGTDKPAFDWIPAAFDASFYD